jgi:hypothetical protein
VEAVKRKPVDMILLRERSKEVAVALKTLTTMGQAGFSGDFLSKAVLMASFRFFEMNAIDEGLEVLALLNSHYIRQVLPKQMDEDPALREVALRIANALVEAGEVRPMLVLEAATLVPPRGEA